MKKFIAYFKILWLVEVSYGEELLMNGEKPNIPLRIACMFDKELKKELSEYLYNQSMKHKRRKV